MRKSVSVLLLLGMSLGLSAQGVKSLFKELRPKRFGVTVGIEEDRIMGFSFDSFVQMSGQQTLAEDLDFNPEEAAIYSGICEVPQIRLQAVWEPSLAPGFEWQTSLVLMPNRVDAITYYGDNWDRYNDYLTLDSWQSEVAADVSLVRRAEFGPLNLYLGAGTNVGWTFDHHISYYAGFDNRASTLSMSEDQAFSRIFPDEDASEEITNYEYTNNMISEGGSGIAQRVYLQSGVGVTLFRRVELGMEGRFGAGYRYRSGTDAIATNLRSWGFYARWVLK